LRVVVPPQSLTAANQRIDFFVQATGSDLAASSESRFIGPQPGER
jgi:hypothetical protein